MCTMINVLRPVNIDRLDILNLTKITCIYNPVLSWDNSNIRLVVVSITTKIDLLITRCQVIYLEIKHII